MNHELLQWTSLPSLCLVAVNLVLCVATSVLVVRLAGLRCRHPEDFLQWVVLASLGQVVGLGLILGYIGMLHWAAYCAGHLVLLAATGFAVARRDRNGLRSVISAEFGPFGSPAHLANNGRIERVGWGLLLLLLVLMFVVNLITAPYNYDSNAYRLTRIAYWLQEGSIGHFPTSDARMNYTSFNPDLVMLWLMAPFRAGYPLVKFAQLTGGVLCLLATCGFARRLGFSPAVRLGSLAVLLGMANAAGQLITSQTDLFTAGCLASGLYFLFLQFHEKEEKWSLPGWLGVALAVGSKGTVFYWGPGLVVFYVGLAATRRVSLRSVLRTWPAAIVLLLLLAAPRYVENLANYGNPFAPAGEIAEIHTAGNHPAVATARDNALAYATQLFNPVSNPLIPTAILQAATEWMIARFPEYWTPAERQWHEGSIRQSMTITMFEPDIGTIGVINFLLFLAGGITATGLVVRGRSAASVTVLILFLSVAAFLLFFCFQQSWTPFKHRYFILLAPFIAIVAAFPFSRLRASAQRIALGMLLIPAVALNAHILFANKTGGFSILRNEARLETAATLRGHRALLEAVAGPGARVAVARPYNVLMSGFFRDGMNRTIRFHSREEVMAYPDAAAYLAAEPFDVLIADPFVFQNRHGPVHAEAYYRLNGHERDSVVGYRRLEPGEAPNAFLDYRSFQDFPEHQARVHALSVQNHGGDVLEFEVFGRHSGVVVVEVKSNRQEAQYRLGPNGLLRIAHPVEENEVVYFRLTPESPDWRAALNAVAIRPLF